MNQSDFRPEDVARFWAKVSLKSEGECWEWQGAQTSQGYGAFKMAGKQNVASRLSWVLVHGDIPDGLVVCHSCDNPPCVNPSHLFLDTIHGNVKDMVSKGRHRNQTKTACGSCGEPFSPENTVVRRGQRTCKNCIRLRNKRYYDQNKAALLRKQGQKRRQAKIGKRP